MIFDYPDTSARTLQMVLIGEDGPASEAVVVALHAGGPGDLVVPVVDGWPTAHREWCSAWEHPDHPDDDADPQPGEALVLDGPTVIVWSLHP